MEEFGKNMINWLNNLDVAGKCTFNLQKVCVVYQLCGLFLKNQKNVNEEEGIADEDIIMRR